MDIPPIPLENVIGGMRLMELLMKYSVVIIPIFTVVLSILVGYLKDKFVDNVKAKKQLQEKQLFELYNQLFIIFLKYNNQLRVEWRFEDLEFDDGELITFKTLECDTKVWNNVFSQTSKLIYDKVYLVEYNDLKLWYNVEMKYQTIQSEEELYDAYNSLKKFIESAVNTYGKLFQDYHQTTQKRRKEKRKELKKQIQKVRSNGFMEKSEKKKRIKKLRLDYKKYKKIFKR